MVRTARRERLRQATQKEILDAAERIAREEGWEGLTIRKVAEAIDYSPAMVYQFFENKDAILERLLQAGFKELLEAMQAAQAIQTGPTERLEALGEAYWDFAMRNPQLYQLMHGTGGLPFDATLVATEIGRVCQLTEDALIAWASSKGRRLADSYGATEIVWATLHGMVSLSRLERLEGGQERARQLMRRAFFDLLIAWETTSLPI